ncbi:MAG: hypothetical protein M3170_00395 [Candidatus Dormibacteraeota bacterium]|nr:hypothetical protein [Candidatus Dormibacteraeota bacterium]
MQRISRAILLDSFFLEASLLRRFDEPGCLIWLIPESVATREAARRGPGSMYDLLFYCLPIGSIGENPSAHIEQALRFVANHR